MKSKNPSGRKVDDRRTGSSNVMYGSDIRELREADLARWKRRLHRKIEVQKFKELSGDRVERKYQEGANDAYDMCLRILNAKWKNL